MSVLDLGCGDDRERWLPGADLCEANIHQDEIPTDLTVSFFFNTEDISADSYDLVWYRFGFRNWYDKTKTVEEISRITKETATVMFEDYREREDGSLIEPNEYIEQLKTVWIGWSFDSVTHNEDSTIVVMTKNWG